MYIPLIPGKWKPDIFIFKRRILNQVFLNFIFKKSSEDETDKTLIQSIPDYTASTTSVWLVLSHIIMI